MAVARTRDGIVEAMELKPEAARQMPFLLSVQFHPERLTARHAGHRAIFNAFRSSLRTEAKIMKAKILIVDDEADMRDLLNAVLDRLLRRRRSRQRRGVAKMLFRRTQPDVILLDVKLPDARRPGLAAANQKTLAGHRSHRADRPRHL